MILPARSELPTLVQRPSFFVRRYWIPLSLLVVGGIADAITTYHNVVLYGHSVEVHPIQQLLFALLGPQVGVPLAKALQMSFALLVAAWWSLWCGWLLALCGLLYGLAALSNHFLWL